MISKYKSNTSPYLIYVYFYHSFFHPQKTRALSTPPSLSCPSAAAAPPPDTLSSSSSSSFSQIFSRDSEAASATHSPRFPLNEKKHCNGLHRSLPEAGPLAPRDAGEARLLGRGGPQGGEGEVRSFYDGDFPQKKLWDAHTVGVQLNSYTLHQTLWVIQEFSNYCIRGSARSFVGEGFQKWCVNLCGSPRIYLWYAFAKGIKIF